MTFDVNLLDALVHRKSKTFLINCVWSGKNLLDLLENWPQSNIELNFHKLHHRSVMRGLRKRFRIEFYQSAEFGNENLSFALLLVTKSASINVIRFLSKEIQSPLINLALESL